MSTIDTALRQVSRRFPEAFARAMAGPKATVRGARWIETQLALRNRHLDRALWAEVDGVARVQHVEWGWRWTRSMPYRMFEYHAMLAMALHADAKGAVVPPVSSTLVLLSGRERAWPARGRYRTDDALEPFSGARFSVDAVYQRSVRSLRARASTLWLAFAPLAFDADAHKLAEVARELTATERDDDRLADLAAAMTVLAEADGRDRGLAPTLAALFPKELIMRSPIYSLGRTEGRTEGLAEGLAPLGRQFSRRLGRELTEAERALLASRLDTIGPQRLGDVVLDLTPAELAAWLADPAAR